MDRPVRGLVPAAQRVQALWPSRMRRLVGSPNPLPGLIVRGWERFAELAPPRVAAAVARLQDEPAPLLAALARHPCTLVHGDLWLVNIALEDDQVTLLDWALASWAPPVIEFASFLIGNAEPGAGQSGGDHRGLPGGLRVTGRTGRACGSACSPGCSSWAGTRRWTPSSTRTRRSATRERAELEWWLERRRARTVRSGFCAGRLAPVGAHRIHLRHRRRGAGSGRPGPGCASGRRRVGASCRPAPRGRRLRR